MITLVIKPPVICHPNTTTFLFSYTHVDTLQSCNAGIYDVLYSFFIYFIRNALFCFFLVFEGYSKWLSNIIWFEGSGVFQTILWISDIEIISSFFGHYSEFCSKYPVELFLEGKILGMTLQGQRAWASSWLLLYFCRLCLREVDSSEGGNAVLELVLSAERGRCWELGTCCFRLSCFPFLSQNA